MLQYLAVGMPAKCPDKSGYDYGKLGGQHYKDHVVFHLFYC